MYFKPFLATLLAVFPFSAAHIGFAQVVPAAHAGSLPLAIGGGFSAYNVEFQHGTMWGPTLWADYTPGSVPAPLRGIGIEAEVRDIDLGHSSSQPSNLREATAGGGVIYTWRHFRNFHPYGKFLASVGVIDFHFPRSTYDYDSRLVTSVGFGFEYRAHGNIWARVDYEYQDWHHLFGKTLDPQGFTLGASYHFSRNHFH
jgi:hypothetical protein